MLPPDGSQSLPLPAAGLPLTAFEGFMLLDDRPTHPMVIVGRFDFTGEPPPQSLAFHVEESRARLAEARRWLDGMEATLHTMADGVPGRHLSLEVAVP